MEIEEKIDTTPLKNIFNISNNHIILLGQPGAGKTTSMKFLCNSILYDEEFYPEKFKLPILIRLRDFNLIDRKEKNHSLILKKLSDILNIKFEFKNENSSDLEYINNVKERFLIDLLNKLEALIILDGFDELVYKKDKEIVQNELKRLFNSIEKSKIILTSRTSDYFYNHENASPFEIAALDDGQIKLFVEKWLDDEKKAIKFCQDLKKSPFSDTSIRPLNLAHLCAIFERINKIPDKPKTVYKKIVNLLLEEWDEQRAIVRKSKYSHFEVDRKFEFLSNLAFCLTTSYFKSVFKKEDLEKVYNRIYEDFNLKQGEVKDVVRELESHTGLFIQSGYEQYEFSHKSLQEYLTAEYIVKLPSIPDNTRTLERIPNELAIAVSISSSPSSYFIELIYNRFNKQLYSYQFLQTFINRLMLEKPDFNYNEFLGIAFLEVYSNYTHSGLKNQGQLKLFLTDNLASEFENFLKVIIPKTSFNKLIENYNLKDIISTEKGDIVNVLTLKNGVPIKSNRFKKNKEHAFPALLYCREVFVNSSNFQLAN